MVHKAVWDQKPTNFLFITPATHLAHYDLIDSIFFLLNLPNPLSLQGNCTWTSVWLEFPSPLRCRTSFFSYSRHAQEYVLPCLGKLLPHAPHQCTPSSIPSGTSTIEDNPVSSLMRWFSTTLRCLLHRAYIAVSKFLQYKVKNTGHSTMCWVTDLMTVSNGGLFQVR